MNKQVTQAMAKIVDISGELVEAEIREIQQLLEEISLSAVKNQMRKMRSLECDEERSFTEEETEDQTECKFNILTKSGIQLEVFFDTVVTVRANGKILMPDGFSD